MEIENCQLALFTKAVHIGDKNPDGEADYDGYSRMSCSFIDGKNTEEVIFPQMKKDYKKNIKYIVILDFSGTVLNQHQTQMR